jgi:hypothetical protein
MGSRATDHLAERLEDTPVAIVVLFLGTCCQQPSSPASWVRPSAVVLGWAYFRTYQLARPSVGVINLGDVALMNSVIILIPYLYLTLPLWLVATILTMAMVGILYFTAEPLLTAVCVSIEPPVR